MMRRFTFFVLFPLMLACGDAGEARVTGQTEQRWDSADGNFTHPTHSYLAEAAIARLRAELPEVAAFAKDIVRGANLELHETPLRPGDDDNDEWEALRVEIGGSNWAADRPGLLWDKARARYASGDRRGAYVLVGIILHYVQDMGVPAHAFHVVHQSTLGSTDHFEVLAFQRWSPIFDHVDRPDPAFIDPVDYIAWSGAWAADEFTRTYPGVTYDRHFFATGWTELDEKSERFVRERQGHTALANTWALRAAARGLATITVKK